MTSTARGTERLAVVSCDSHAGPRLREDLESYCPKEYREDFDQFIAANVDTFNKLLLDRFGKGRMDATDLKGSDLLSGRSTLASEVSIIRQILNRQTAGHYDIHTRLREMNWDGCAAEVIFHGSQNTEVFPFSGYREWDTRYDSARERELAVVGYRIYNHWLSDFVSVEPERHIGLLYPPMWDVNLAVKELEWGAKHGLRGVNFPAPRHGIEEFDHPSWEPFWSACEEYDLCLATHAGVPGNNIFGPQLMAISRMETAGWPARRGMHRLIFGGVFERHPKLKLILTEQARGWWPAAMKEMDDLWANPSDELRAQVPKPPSEYMKTNVYIGGSFMPPTEVHEAIEQGFVDNLTWGRDYPHGEGTYKFPEYEGEESQTRHYLRWAFEGCPLPEARKILSENAYKAYGLDPVAVAKVAERVGPLVDEVIEPLDEIPADWAWHLVDVQTGELAPR